MNIKVIVYIEESRDRIEETLSLVLKEKTDNNIIIHAKKSN